MAMSAMLTEANRKVKEHGEKIKADGRADRGSEAHTD